MLHPPVKNNYRQSPTNVSTAFSLTGRVYGRLIVWFTATPLPATGSVVVAIPADEQLQFLEMNTSREKRLENCDDSSWVISLQRRSELLIVALSHPHRLVMQRASISVI